MREFPDKLEIVPLLRPPSVAVNVPGSKSITNRALVLGALASWDKASELRGALESEDTTLCVKALGSLGFNYTAWHLDEPDLVMIVGRSPERAIPAAEADLFVGNSGTTMRFLTALVTLGMGRFRLDGIPRMRERPIGDLLDALAQLGVKAWSENHNRCPPVIVEAHGLAGGSVAIKGDVSSQFLSGLLMACPLADRRTTIEVIGPLVSRPYIDMTVAMMRQFGAEVEETQAARFEIPPRQRYQLRDAYLIEPDASAASYFFAAAAIAGGRVTVLDLPENSLQGDVAFVDVLADMGCRVARCSSGITVHGRDLHGIDVDMNAISDTVMTLAAVACFAQGPTTIRNIAHIRHKETDRIAALATELRKVGAEVEEYADGLRITPRPLHGTEIDTYNDHRMAMSMALLGLKVPGIVIKDPGCVAKTYPGFFQDLERLR